MTVEPKITLRLQFLTRGVRKDAATSHHRPGAGHNANTTMTDRHMCSISDGLVALSRLNSASKNSSLPPINPYARATNV